MIKRYSFKNEQQAKVLVLELFNIQISSEDEKGNPIEDNRTIKQILGLNTTSKDVQGIALDIQPSIKHDEEGEVIEVEHLTYDIDIVWRNEAGNDWQAFEVEPETPNQNFM